MKKIITCTGYFSTGSSLITDYLKEFEEIDCLGAFEFTFLQDPNGIADLEDRLLRNNSRLNSERAIYEYMRLVRVLNSNYTNQFWKSSQYKILFNNKFLKYSEEYVKSLVEIEWQGYWHDFKFRDFSFFSRLKEFIYRIISVISRKKINLANRPMYFSYPVEDFYKKTKLYLEKLFDEASTKKFLALDQLIPCSGINRYLNYFEDIKVVVVDRDPRDLYVLNKEIWKDNVIPTENVEVFIKHFKAIRRHQKYEKEDQCKILRIKFEDAVYNYQETMKKVDEFLEIQNLNHKDARKYFNPSKSIFNTQVFKLYNKYNEDIKKIEEELPEYCYKFPYTVDRSEEEEIF